jgi:hypothetical protein
MTAQRIQQTGLDPTSGHVANIAKSTEDCSSFSKLGLSIPRTIDEMCTNASAVVRSRRSSLEINLLADSRQGTFKPIEDEYLPDSLNSECDQSQNGPESVRRNEDISWRRNGC